MESWGQCKHLETLLRTEGKHLLQRAHRTEGSMDVRLKTSRRRIALCPARGIWTANSSNITYTCIFSLFKGIHNSSNTKDSWRVPLNHTASFLTVAFGSKIIIKDNSGISKPPLIDLMVCYVCISFMVIAFIFLAQHWTVYNNIGPFESFNRHTWRDWGWQSEDDVEDRCLQPRHQGSKRTLFSVVDVLDSLEEQALAFGSSCWFLLEGYWASLTKLTVLALEPVS